MYGSTVHKQSKIKAREREWLLGALASRSADQAVVVFDQTVLLRRYIRELQLRMGMTN